MYKNLGFFALLLVVSATAVHAQTTHIVDLSGTGDFISIHAAVSAASAGDTIRVQPDQYPFTASLGKISVTKKLVIIGSGYMPVEEGGTELIDIAGSGYFALTGSADGTVIKGFRVQGAASFLSTESGTSGTTIEENLLISGSSVLTLAGSQDTVRSNIFETSGSSSVYTTGPNTQVLNNIFSASNVGNYGGAVTVGTSGSGVIIAYNLFLKGSFNYFQSGAINISAGAPEVYSNAFAGGTGSGLYNTASTFATNNGFYGSVTSFGLNPVEAAPDFVEFDVDNEDLDIDAIDEANFDFSLADGSGWIDAGRTGTLYLDTNGSRSDIGIYAGPRPFADGRGAPSVPVVIDFQVSPTTVSPSGTITIKATGRIGGN
ncbi:MAG: hypothetical protein WD016_03695 [Balneolaceae bacterium]